MAIVGVICEYNPFHLGHQKQFAAIRDSFGTDTAIVCVMSGNYVQRGEPAVFDASLRARAAADCGADLVLELPVTRCLSSAEGFASGGVEILEALGCVDAICFGSETGALAPIWQTAQALLRPDFPAALQKQLKKGCSFAAARQRALEQLGVPGVTVSSPNDILAVEYCKALLKLGSSIQPFCIQRKGNYNARTLDAENPSAAALRAEMECGDWLSYLPPAAARVFKDGVRHTLEAGERAILARLRGMQEAEFACLPFGSEGLWRRLMYACRSETTLEEIISKTKSKRYARSRICRMVMCAYLGLSAADLDAPIPFVRILAAGPQGRQVLRRAKAAGRLPLCNAGQPIPDEKQAEQERRCADLYTLFAENREKMLCQTKKYARIYCKEP